MTRTRSDSTPATLPEITRESLDLFHRSGGARSEPSTSASASSGPNSAWIGNTDPLLAAVWELLRAKPPMLEADRVLAAVLFIDVERSTQRATAIGDARWPGSALSASISQIRLGVQRF
jgi:hypothetical protein